MIVFVNPDVCVVAKGYYVSMLCCVVVVLIVLYNCAFRTLILAVMCSSR